MKGLVSGGGPSGFGQCSGPVFRASFQGQCSGSVFRASVQGQFSGSVFRASVGIRAKGLGRRIFYARRVWGLFLSQNRVRVLSESQEGFRV